MDLEELRGEAERLIRIHGLEGWTFHFGKRKRSLGTCYYGRKEVHVSRFHALADQRSEVLETLRHEIAHAIVGHKAGHGAE